MLFSLNSYGFLHLRRKTFLLHCFNHAKEQHWPFVEYLHFMSQDVRSHFYISPFLHVCHENLFEFQSIHEMFFILKKCSVFQPTFNWTSSMVDALGIRIPGEHVKRLGSFTLKTFRLTSIEYPQWNECLKMIFGSFAKSGFVSLLSHGSWSSYPSISRDMTMGRLHWNFICTSSNN